MLGNLLMKYSEIILRNIDSRFLYVLCVCRFMRKDKLQSLVMVNTQVIVNLERERENIQRSIVCIRITGQLPTT